MLAKLDPKPEGAAEAVKAAPPLVADKVSSPDAAS